MFWFSSSLPIYEYSYHHSFVLQVGSTSLSVSSQGFCWDCQLGIPIYDYYSTYEHVSTDSDWSKNKYLISTGQKTLLGS